MNGKQIQNLIIGALALVAVVSTILVFKLRDDMARNEAQKPAVETPAQAGCAPCPAAAGRTALEVIHARSSVRTYKDAPVEPGMISQLVKAGMAAPTAGNRQPWYFVSTTDRVVLQKLASANEHGAMLATAGAAIVVVGSPSEGLRGESGEMWVQDCSAATQNILLAAEAVGLGAVWIGVHPVAERVAAVRAALEIPAEYVPLSVISIGWPDTPPQPKDKFKPEKVFADKWGTPWLFDKSAPLPPSSGLPSPVLPSVMLSAGQPAAMTQPSAAAPIPPATQVAPPPAAAPIPPATQVAPPPAAAPIPPATQSE